MGSRYQLNALGLIPTLIIPWIPLAFGFSFSSCHPFALQVAWNHQLSGGDDVAAYSSLLRSCTSSLSILHGMYIQHDIIRCGIENHPDIQNCLLLFFCKCGALKEAHFSFIRHLHKDAYSWDFLIKAHVQHGSTKIALHLFDQLQHEAFLPDKVIYSSTLLACEQDSLPTGQRIHARLTRSPYLSNIVLRTALISLYNNCGDINTAKELFNESSDIDEVSCNAMIEGCAQHEKGDEAFLIYERMQREGLTANSSTYVSLLSSCVNNFHLTLGRGIHVKVIENWLENDLRVSTAILSMYGRCGDLDVARKLFTNVCDKDVVMWNALLAAHAQNGFMHDTLSLYGQMQQEGFLPNMVTFVSVLHACSTEAIFVHGQHLHACIISGDQCLDCVIGNALVTMYGKSGSIVYAQSVFEDLPQKDVVSWSSMIGACALHGHAKGAWQFLCRMCQEGIMPNEVTLVSAISSYASLADPIECKSFHTWLTIYGEFCFGDVDNALIDMYSKSGSIEDAQHLFGHLAEKDMVSWNALISAYAQNGHVEEALQLYEQMQVEGVLANSITFASILFACAEHVNLLKGQQFNIQILHVNLDLDNAVWNSLMNMYGKCGVYAKALDMFNGLAMPNLISWNSVISGCAHHGEGERSLDLLSQMYQLGVQPNTTTFTSVLTACSHSGLVEEGQFCIFKMIEPLDKAITVDHFNCLIDVLGRLGRIAEAWSLTFRMPFQPARASYTSLLDACRHHIEVELGQHTTKHAYELVPEDRVLPVLMSNLFGMSGVGESTDLDDQPMSEGYAWSF